MKTLLFKTKLSLEEIEKRLKKIDDLNIDKKGNRYRINYKTIFSNSLDKKLILKVNDFKDYRSIKGEFKNNIYAIIFFKLFFSILVIINMFLIPIYLKNISNKGYLTFLKNIKFTMLSLMMYNFLSYFSKKKI